MLGQAIEILAALRQLGEQLSPQEEAFLQEHKTNELAGFEQASSDLGTFFYINYLVLVMITFNEHLHFGNRSYSTNDFVYLS